MDPRRDRSLEHYPLLAFFGTLLCAVVYCAVAGDPRLFALSAVTLPSFAGGCIAALRVWREQRGPR